MHRLICTIIFCFCTLHSLTAEILNFQEVDSTTYRLYNEQQWDSVIELGNRAIRQHIDYYYLRVRMGISYFNKKKFRQAIVHLRKALEYNSAGETAMQYLYLCYVYSDQFEAAGKIAHRFDDSTAMMMKTKHHRIIDMIGIEAGQKISSDTALYGNASFANLFICHHIGRAVSFFHALTYSYQPTPWGKITQEEYYLGSNILPGKGWLLSPAVHVIYLKTLVNSHYLNMDFGDSTVSNTTSEWQTVGSFTLKKQYSYFDIAVAGSYSYLYNQSFTQQTASVNLYPLANNKLIIGGALLANQDSLKTKTLFSYMASASCVLFKRLKLCAAYYQGNALYTNEYNGYIVNNCPDITNSKITFSPSFKLCKHIIVYGLIQLEEKTHQYPSSDYLGNVKFYYKTALAGIKIIM